MPYPGVGKRRLFVRPFMVSGGGDENWLERELEFRAVCCWR